MKARLTPEQMNAVTRNVLSKFQAIEGLTDEINMFNPEYYAEGALESMTAKRDAIRTELCSYFDTLNPSVDILENVKADWESVDEKSLQDPQEKDRKLKFIYELINLRKNNSPITDSNTKLRALRLVFGSIPTLDHYASSLEWCDKNIARANEGRSNIKNYVLSDGNSKIANKYGMLSEYPGTVGSYIKKLEDFMKTGQERLNHHQLLQVAYITGAACCYSVSEYLKKLSETTTLTNPQKYGIELFRRDVYKIQQYLVPALSMIDTEAETAKRDKVNLGTYMSPEDTTVCKMVNNFVSDYDVKRVCVGRGIGATCSPKKRTGYYCPNCTHHQGIDQYYDYCADPKNKEYVFHRYSPLLRMEILDLLSANDFFTTLCAMITVGGMHQGSFCYVAETIKNAGGEDIIIVPAMNLYIDADRYNYQKYVGREEQDKVRITEARENTKVEIGKWYDRLLTTNEMLQFIKKQKLHVSERERGDNEPF